MSDIVRNTGSNDGSVVNATDSAPIEDTVILDYIRNLIEYRNSLHSFQKRHFLDVYSAIITGELTRYSLGDYMSFNATDTEMRVKERSSGLSEVREILYGVLPKLDDAIKAYVRVLRRDMRMKAMEENGAYFQMVLNAANAIPFDTMAFGLDPAPYLDKFVPWIVTDRDLPHYLALIPSLVGAFALEATKEEVEEYQYDIARNDSQKTRIARYRCIALVNAVANSSLQKQIVDKLKAKHVTDLRTFDFGTLA
ncbi:hypothetical protein FBU59_001577 [Linderina macrospora]|uniref:Uncharacterized protein n=1 Tax=Linderina macrospora TaxID=4868 RepID=A0ACC1JDF3_9FUNG|nr:hypothetical protein FBU59_001577 [Linderina macrospora]